jgi:hypothetical protein
MKNCFFAKINKNNKYLARQTKKEIEKLKIRKENKALLPTLQK